MSSVFSILVHTLILVPQRHTPPCDREARKRVCKSTPCQRLLLFAMRVDLNYKVCSPSPLISSPGYPLIGNPSMIIFKVPPVIPTNVLGQVIMFFVGTFGLMAQVRSSIYFPDADIQVAKTLLTMGFQRETAARGSLAMFTAVRPQFVLSPWANHSTVIGCVCSYARVHRFSDNAHSTLYRRDGHNHKHGHLCFRNLSPFILTWLVLRRPHQLTKQTASRPLRPATDSGVEQGSLATPTTDDDR